MSNRTIKKIITSQKVNMGGIHLQQPLPDRATVVYLLLTKQIMKKILLVLLIAMTFMSCKKETVNPTIEPNYTVEGKWIWSPTENRADANTMYEFVDETKYTSYSSPTSDFNDLDSSDRIPGSEAYTFDGDSLLFYGTLRGITFECDGGILIMDNGINQLWRLSSDCQ